MLNVCKKETREKVVTYCDRSIEVCLYFVLFCIPFSRAGIEIFVWAAIFLWILKRVMGYRCEGCLKLVVSTELNKLLVVFIIVNFLAMCFSLNFALSFRGFFGKTVKFIALYFMMVETFNNDRRLKNVLTVLIISVILVIFDAAAQYAIGVDFLRGFSYASNSYRLSACFTNPNNFAAWLVLVIPVFLALPMVNSQSTRRSWVISCLSMLIAIFLCVCLAATFSRGAWVGMISGFSLLSYYAIRSFSLKVRMLILIVTLCSVGFFLLFSQPFKTIINGLLNFKFKGGTSIGERVLEINNVGLNASRMSLWKEALTIIEDFPVLGCGLNTYARIAPKYKITEDGGVYPHNSFFQMGAETGILGLFVFFLVVQKLFKLGFNALNMKKNPIILGLLSGILAFLVHSFFDNNLFSLPLATLFWVSVGILISLMNQGKARYAVS